MRGIINSALLTLCFKIRHPKMLFCNILEDYHLGLHHLKNFILADSIDVGSFWQEKRKWKTKQFIICRNCIERSQCRVLPPRNHPDEENLLSHVYCRPLLLLSVLVWVSPYFCSLGRKEGNNAKGQMSRCWVENTQSHSIFTTTTMDPSENRQSWSLEEQRDQLISSRLELRVPFSLY